MKIFTMSLIHTVADDDTDPTSSISRFIFISPRFKILPEIVEVSFEALSPEMPMNVRLAP